MSSGGLWPPRQTRKTCWYVSVPFPLETHKKNQPPPPPPPAQGSFIRNGLTQAECELECVFSITAGSDNSATAIRITLLNVISNPRVYARLKHEIFEAVRQGRASSPVTMDEAKALDYLRAVMYEGLRMRAPTPGLFLKTVPPGGDHIDGKFIPAGVGVGTNSSAVLASRELFGDDADTFRPERFLEVGAGRRADMERDVEVVFGYGRWVCMGKNIVWLELYKVLFEVSLWVGEELREAGLTGHSCFATLTFSLSMRPSLGRRSRGRCGSSRTFGSWRRSRGRTIRRRGRIVCL